VRLASGKHFSAAHESKPRDTLGAPCVGENLRMEHSTNRCSFRAPISLFPIVFLSRGKHWQGSIELPNGHAPLHSPLNSNQMSERLRMLDTVR
jgi:hypothetical protein